MNYLRLLEDEVRRLRNEYTLLDTTSQKQKEEIEKLKAFAKIRVTELEFLKEERERIKSILAGYNHEDPHYYGIYLNSYEKLSALIGKLDKNG